MALTRTYGGRTWYWWALGISGSVIVMVGLGTFTLAYGTMERQVQHNIDKEAHPTIAGQLMMIESDLGKLDSKVEANARVLGEVHDAQIEQNVLLEQIERTINDGGR